MVTHGRVELLAHPLSQKYLQMKWNAYGKYFHVTNLLIYTVFLAFVTIYASQLMQNVDQNSTTVQSTVSIPSNSSTMVSKINTFLSNENIEHFMFLESTAIKIFISIQRKCQLK